MPFRILSATPLLLLLLSTDARSGQIHPPLQPDVDAHLIAAIKADGRDAAHLRSQRSAANLDFDWHRAGVSLRRAVAGKNNFSSPDRHKQVLETASRRGDLAILFRKKTVELPFQYLDFRRYLRLEWQSLHRAPSSSAVVVLPLPASGWLLGTAILGGLLLGNGSRRAFRRRRQPLRYRTV